MLCVDGYFIECVKYIALVLFQIWNFLELLDCGNIYVTLGLGSYEDFLHIMKTFIFLGC
jgi:hypothetical protein